MSSVVGQRPETPQAIAAREGRQRWVSVLAGAFTVLLLAAAVEIVLDAAVGHAALIPKSPHISGWLEGVGERLGYRVFLIALLVSVGSYVGMLLLAKRLPTRWAIALTVALQLIVFAGPILISTDVFSYIAYARMGVVHGINPYTHGPISIVGDPVYHYVGKDWKLVATAYGPLYTLISYPLAPLGVVGALWGMKLEALLASAGTLALTWRCARLRGLDQRVALIAVGVNPLWVIYGLGGAHNDLILTLFMMGAVFLTLSSEERPRREALAGAAVVGGALVKATGFVLLPFIVISRRRVAPILGAALAGLLCALVAYAVFGIHGVDIISALNRDAALVSTDSFPNELAHLFGKPGVFPVDHDLLKGGLVLIVLYLLWRTWRGYDWVAASGWTLLAICVTSTWLLAWYTLWSLPLAAVSRDRRLLYATFAVQGLFVIHQTSPLLAPVS